MAATASLGEIVPDHMYSIEELGNKFNRDRSWVYDTFVRPVDPKTRKRLVDSSGKPIPGVLHFKRGSIYLIPGKAAIAFMLEHGEQEVE